MRSHRTTQTMAAGMSLLAILCGCSPHGDALKGDVEGRLTAQYEFEDDYLETGNDM